MSLDIHWIVKNKRVWLPLNKMDYMPRAGDELRVKDGEFFRVVRIVWCLDEKSTIGPHSINLPNHQRVNIELVEI